jgi:hypothetical protein
MERRIHFIELPPHVRALVIAEDPSFDDAPKALPSDDPPPPTIEQQPTTTYEDPLAFFNLSARCQPAAARYIVAAICWAVSLIEPMFVIPAVGFTIAASFRFREALRS